MRQVTRIDGPPPEPSMRQMVNNAAKELRKWQQSKFARTTPMEATRRQRICMDCHLWRHVVRLGMGKCVHPDCGCTRLMWKIASKSCPLGKWGRVDNQKDNK